MADARIVVFNADGQSAFIDYRTESTNLDGRQVIVIGDPAVNVNIAPVQTTDPTSAQPGLVVRDVNTSAVVAALGTTINVALKPGTIAVQLDPGHELGTIKGNTNTLTVFLPDTGHTLGKVDAGIGTFNVQFDPGHTLGSVLVNPGTGTLNVQLDPGHTLGAISSIGTTVTVKTDPSSVLAGISSSINVYLGATAGSLGVRVGQVDGSVAVYFSQSKPIVLADVQHTASVFTFSGSTSGGTTSGVTILAPSASYNYKIIAYSLQTTALSSTVWKFTNGAGTETELWRPLITAPSTTSTPIGANMAVPSPSFIFATGVNVTLALKSDTGSLVHYSVSLIKESA